MTVLAQAPCTGVRTGRSAIGIFVHVRLWRASSEYRSLPGSEASADRLVARLGTVDRNLRVRGELGGISIMEVWMRPPEVFVRELSLDEGNRLKRLSRKAASEVKCERALICWASATMMNPQQIAALVGTDETHVRKVIHAFDERGFSSLDPEPRAGRPRRITAKQRARGPGHALVAGPPRTLPRAATDRAGVAGASGTDSEGAGCRFNARGRGRPAPTPTTSPKQHECWRCTPRRPRTGRHGVRYVMGAFDVHAVRLRVRLRPRRRGSDNLAFLKQIRGCYPKRMRIYWVQDNSARTGRPTSARSPTPTTSS